jgi:uncharacterized lipoprotein YmbA
MTRSPSRARRRDLAAPVTLVALSMAAAGCGHSPATQFYTLDARAMARDSPSPRYSGAPVRLRSVRLPPAMDRPQLVARAGRDRLDVDDYAQWAAPVGELARSALAQDLAARLPAGELIYPDAPRPAAARDLSVVVLDFGVAGGEATLDASWSLTGPGDARPPGRTVRLTAPAAGRGAPATAEALGTLLGLLADDIARSLGAGM